jgi:hypothetical protein
MEILVGIALVGVVVGFVAGGIDRLIGPPVLGILVFALAILNIVPDLNRTLSQGGGASLFLVPALLAALPCYVMVYRVKRAKT